MGALAERAPESEAYALAERTLRVQYAFEPSLESSWESRLWSRLRKSLLRRAPMSP